MVSLCRYAENMQRVSRLFRDRVSSPAELVVYWTEYVIRHGGATHFQSAANEMPLYEYLMLDIIGLVCVCAFVCIYSLRKLVSAFINVVRRVHFKGAKRKLH